MTWMIAFGALVPCFVYVSYIAVRATNRWIEYEARDDRARLALARALRSWKYQGDQGDGIDDDLMPEFCRLCSELGIVVDFPDGAETYRYTLTPTLTEYIQGQDARTVDLPVLPPLEARDRTKGWG